MSPNDPDQLDVEFKLQKAGNKKSAFERSRAEAEAKRQREAQETAAIYDDFVKSFDRDDGYPTGHGTSFRGPACSCAGARVAAE